MLHKVHYRFRVFDGPVPKESRQIELDGYAYVEGFLAADELAALRAEILHVYDTVPPEQRAGSPNSERAAMFRYQRYNRGALCQAFTGHPRILQIVEPLLGPDCHVISSTAWRNPPDSALYTTVYPASRMPRPISTSSPIVVCGKGCSSHSSRRIAEATSLKL